MTVYSFFSFDDFQLEEIFLITSLINLLNFIEIIDEKAKILLMIFIKKR
jgi:hypothetical protein